MHAGRAESGRLVFASLVLVISRRSSAHGSRTVQSAPQLATGGRPGDIEDSAADWPAALGRHAGLEDWLWPGPAVPDLTRAGVA